MTTRHAGYLVVLEDDIREDDATYLISAIRMLRGVATVEPVISDINTLIARGRRDVEWENKLRTLLDEMRS